ncbi:Peptide methionine sulfoxide reductase MsrA [Tessaracoccus lapidicaptus]|nr:Peptide methionine sulfoxide reductase MsrA [Tessaracoccus lapidicaptus]
MDIDVLAWLNSRMAAPQMVSAADALPGRSQPVLAPMPVHEVLGLPLDEVPPGAEVAYFALGCYWGVERLFWETDGVVNTAAGFMGGFTPNPTYRETCTGRTGHTETVQVVFDPQRVSYEELLRLFWENHDPTQLNRQGNDIGTQYRSAVFPVDEEQRAAAERTRGEFQENLSAAGYGEITTEITPGQTFYFAEVEHQQYLHKNPHGYCPVHATGVACGPRP